MQNERVRATLTINSVPTTKQDRANLITWLEHQLQALKEDDPHSFNDIHTARLIECPSQ